MGGVNVPLRLATIAFGMALLSGCGAAQRQAPSDAQVAQFIHQREFALSVARRIPPPMAGTSCTGACRAPFTAELSDNLVLIPPHDHVKVEIARTGYWRSTDLHTLEFDVDLDEQLVASTTIQDITARLRDHYGASLKKAGWHLAGDGCGGDEPRHRIWNWSIWSDQGPNRPVDYGYGWLQIMVSICVDTTARRAHVVMGASEALGL